MRETIHAAEVSKARNLMVKELEWMRRMPKARGTKSKSRIEAFYDLKDIATQNLNQNELEISVQTTRLGNKIIELHNISKQFDDLNIIENFSYIFKKKDRIGVVGKNGIGKSTFLDLLTQTQAPSSGEVIHGSTLKIGYYTQHTNNLNNDNRIIDEVKEIAEYVTLGTGEQVAVSKLLDMFLFPPSVQHTPISKLSGGERRRTEIARALATDPKFILLDEPFAGVDPIAVEDIQGIVYKLKNRNIGILITDHNVQETLSITDRAYLLFEGKLLKQGTAEELAEDEMVRKVYLGKNFVLRRAEVTQGNNSEK